jgi:hypothetical protein
MEISEGERALLAVYDELHAVLREHGETLPPFAARNGAKALAALWQVANGLGARPGQLYDVGA